MNPKIEIKQEDPLSDEAALQNETEFFHEVVTMKRNSDDVLLDNDCDIAIKTEIKSETPPKYFVEQVKFEIATCSNNWEIDRKIENADQTLVSDFGSQNENEFLPEDPLMKAKVEPWWLETETSPVCDDIKDGDFPSVKSLRFSTEAVPSANSGKSPLSSAEVSGRGTSFFNGKDHLECEGQKSDITDIPNVEHVLSEQSDKYSDGEEMYMSPLYLKQESLIHGGKAPHQCKTCDKSFIQLESLIMYNLINESKKSHQCKTCDKSFTQLGNLKMQNLIHDSKKPHQCETCDKTFTRASTLKRHNLIHEGKKPYQCKTCDLSFTQASSLKRHTFIHEGKKPHHCRTCDKSFTHLSNLKVHNLIHDGKKPYKCKTCDTSFTQVSHLKRHNLIHEGKKPHKCKTCNKSFTQVSHLKRHNLIHEGKKPHQCRTCDKSFSRLSHLKTHNLIHEGKKP